MAWHAHASRKAAAQQTGNASSPSPLPDYPSQPTATQSSHAEKAMQPTASWLRIFFLFEPNFIFCPPFSSFLCVDHGFPKSRSTPVILLGLGIRMGHLGLRLPKIRYVAAAGVLVGRWHHHNSEQQDSCMQTLFCILSSSFFHAGKPSFLPLSASGLGGLDCLRLLRHKRLRNCICMCWWILRARAICATHACVQQRMCGEEVGG